MAKKQRSKGKGGPGGAGDGDDTPVLPKLPERMASPFRDALLPLKKQLDAAAKLEKKPPAEPPAPLPPRLSKSQRRARGEQLPEEEAMALSLAMQGVRPLGSQKPARVSSALSVTSRTGQVAPFGPSAEDQARARLDALVAQDVRFRIEHDRDYVSGSRIDASPRAVRELARRTRADETLDLHGMTSREAREAVPSFVRKAHKKGLDVLCIVHGKGQHSEGGLGVLRDVVVRALTETGAAPLVSAFVTAGEALGGSGALLLELKR